MGTDGKAVQLPANIFEELERLVSGIAAEATAAQPPKARQPLSTAQLLQTYCSLPSEGYGESSGLVLALRTAAFHYHDLTVAYSSTIPDAGNTSPLLASPSLLEDPNLLMTSTQNCLLLCSLMHDCQCWLLLSKVHMFSTLACGQQLLFFSSLVLRCHILWSQAEGTRALEASRVAVRQWSSLILERGSRLALGCLKLLDEEGTRGKDETTPYIARSSFYDICRTVARGMLREVLSVLPLLIRRSWRDATTIVELTQPVCLPEWGHHRFSLPPAFLSWLASHHIPVTAATEAPPSLPSTGRSSLSYCLPPRGRRSPHIFQVNETDCLML